MSWKGCSDTPGAFGRSQHQHRDCFVLEQPHSGLHFLELPPAYKHLPEECPQLFAVHLEALPGGTTPWGISRWPSGSDVQ